MRQGQWGQGQQPGAATLGEIGQRRSWWPQVCEGEHTDW